LVHEDLINKDTLQKEATGRLKILFVINPGSGNHSMDWPKEIAAYFNSYITPLSFTFSILALQYNR